ncbi:hypothetical protein DFJ74DRAFT_735298, partial [Hyaloraphidium curvatum]
MSPARPSLGPNLTPADGHLLRHGGRPPLPRRSDPDGPVVPARPEGGKSVREQPLVRLPPGPGRPARRAGRRRTALAERRQRDVRRGARRRRRAQCACGTVPRPREGLRRRGQGEGGQAREAEHAAGVVAPARRRGGQRGRGARHRGTARQGHCVWSC